MGQYRKKPVVVEARRYTRNGLEAEQVAEWCGGDQTDGGLEFRRLGGTVLVNYGDWIIKDADGKFYSCKPAVFEASYEPA
jgi:hypothetical protein